MHAHDETDDAPRLCACCGAEAHDVDRRGEFVSAGYGSKHDAQTYAVLDTSAVPEGFLCDGCVDRLIADGHLVHVYSFGQMQNNLPAEAYAVIFRSGQSHIKRLISDLAQDPTQDGVDKLLRTAVDMRVREPFTAGLIAGVIAQMGYDTRSADIRYCEALAGHEADEKAMMDFIMEEMERPDSPDEQAQT